MDVSPEIQTKHLPSLILSVLGWIALVVIIGWFFLVAKNQSHALGYQLGVNEQNAIDQSKYDQVFGQPVTATPAGDILNVRIISAKPGSVYSEPITFAGSDPFAPATKKQTITYDAQTTIVKRVVLSPSELEKRHRDAQAQGQNTALIPPFDDQPALPEDLQPGFRLEVIAKAGTDLNSSSIPAQFIAIIDEASLPTAPPNG